SIQKSSPRSLPRNLRKFRIVLIPVREARRRIIEQGVVAAAGHLLEGGGPALPGLSGRPDDERVVLCADLNLAAQAGLLEKRLGDANALGVADADDSRLHDRSPPVPTNVATQPVPGNASRAGAPGLVLPRGRGAAPGYSWRNTRGNSVT